MDITCALCGQIIQESEAIERTMPDGTVLTVCDDCKEREVAQCRECRGWFAAEEMRHDTCSDNYMCESCYEDGDYDTCGHCGAITNDGDDVHTGYRSYQYEHWCDDCIQDSAYTCDRCGEFFAYENLGESDDNRFICDSCYQDYYTRCNDCGDIISRDAYYDEDEEEYYCESCWESHSGFDLVNDYYYKPRPVFSKTEKDSNSELMLGVELEIDKGNNQRDCAAELDTLTDKLYMKHDGSLSNRRVGIEIVTHPCTLAYHQEEFPWQEICDTALKYGYKSHDAGTCGLHVHVGRAELGDNHTAARAAALVDRLWPTLSVLSRRYGDDYWAHRPNAIPPLMNELLTEERAEEKIYAEIKRSGRYQAVNMQNQNTVEFRFNRGTLKYSTLIATLQMIYVLCMYAKSKTLKDCCTANWSDVMGDYKVPELRAYSTERLAEDAPEEEPEFACPRFITEEEYQNRRNEQYGRRLHEASNAALEAIRRQIDDFENSGDISFGDRVYVTREARPYTVEEDATAIAIGHNGDYCVYFPGLEEAHEGNSFISRLNTAYGLSLPENGHCGNWFVPNSTITRAPNPTPREGDIVLYNHIRAKAEDSLDYIESLKGVVGKVVHVRGDGIIGVEWANAIVGGHNCDGHAERHHGWYVKPCSLINLSR